MKNVLFSCLLVVFFLPAYAQTGKISGKVIDKETGEDLIGATVQIQETMTGAVTDIYGNYQINIVPGTYTLKISYVSYTAQIVQNVPVIEGEITRIDMALSSDMELEEVIVEAEAIQNNEVALLKIQKKALAVQDGISAAEFKKLGASNAADGVKQVTGATVEGGKYVVMRGLGDRYSITQMNDVTIPSADPYRNSSSMDLVPSNMIENIVAQKTYTADQPGNFTGGKINITSRSIPEEFYFNYSISATYNTQSSFQNGFLLDPAANNRGIGYDNGTRAKPKIFDTYNIFFEKGNAESTVREAYIPDNTIQRTLIDKSTKALDNGFVPVESRSGTNHGMQVSFGNQYSINGKPLGFNVGVNYSRSFDHVGNGRTGLYTDGGENQLITEQNISRVTSTDGARIGGLFSASFQPLPNHEFSFNTIYSHNGESQVSTSEGFWRNSASPSYQTKSIKFQERSLLNNQISGKHVFNNFRGLKVDWIAGVMTLSQDEPDYRQFSYVVQDNGAYVMNKSEIGRLPSHFYRYLEDNQKNFKVDFTLPYSDDSENIVKVGFSYSDKDRAFTESLYGHFKEPIKQQPGVNDNYISFTEANGDFDAYFSQNNYGVVSGPAVNQLNGRTEYGIGNYYSDQTVLGNSYTGEERISAFYVMATRKWTERLKLIGGVRVEHTNMGAFSADTTLRNFGKVDEEGNPILESRNGSISKTDFLPSFNAIYKIDENSNFRFSLSQTLARPNMREISPFSSVGAPNEPIVTGNKDLKRTLIKNVDLRYEIFPRSGELIAFSAYYKDFTDPIVWFLISKGSSAEITPINVSKARVFGFEAEVRKSLEFIHPALSNFKFGTNVSIIHSRADKDDAELASLATANRPEIENHRPFMGQSPFIINFNLNHKSEALNWENGVSFNIFGDRLAFVTDALDPDVYERSRPSLNFVSSKKVNDHWSISFKANNLFNMNYLKTYDREGGDYIFESFRRGRSFNISLSYSL